MLSFAPLPKRTASWDQLNLSMKACIILPMVCCFRNSCLLPKWWSSLEHLAKSGYKPYMEDILYIYFLITLLIFLAIQWRPNTEFWKFLLFFPPSFYGDWKKNIQNHFMFEIWNSLYGKISPGKNKRNFFTHDLKN